MLKMVILLKFFGLLTFTLISFRLLVIMLASDCLNGLT
jgi:hypothetical protein